jgi:glycosyltransferase involved in cell wall biosynthesis
MSCGTPAIVYNNTAAPELITDDTGIVVNRTGDVDGVVKAIETVLARGKQSYTDACRRRAVEHFDNRKCSAKYLDLYNELLA